MPERRDSKRAVRAALLIAWLALVGACAHGSQTQPPAAPAPLLPVARLALHWNDAGDTTRVLRIPADRPFRTAITLTGVADSLQGFTLHFRLEPTTNSKGTAWTLANTESCLAAVWSGTIERDKVPAPWPNKLMITDANALPDGSVTMIVAATFDLVAMHPDSTYLVCHMNFTPPEAASDSVRCWGWDAPVRLYIENATLLFTTVEEPVFEMGKALTFEPQPPAKR